MNITRRRAQLWLATALFGSSRLAPAQAAPAGYPGKPLRVIVPYAPGGTHDTMGRLFGQKLSESLRQPVVVDNRPGAGGTIAALAAAKAPPDGCTLFVADVGANAIAPTLYPAPGYSTGADFAAVAWSGTHPTVLAATPSLPANTIAELLALARSRPGSLSYGSVGVGSLSQLVMEMVKSATGADFLHVPYKGGPSLLNATVGGEVHLAPVSVQSAMPFISSGKLKAIVQFGARRSPLLADLPTLQEQGHRGMVAETWAGFLVPAATPREIVAFLNQELNRIGRTEEIRGKLKGMGWDPVEASPEEFQRFMAAEGEKYARIIKAANIRAE